MEHHDHCLYHLKLDCIALAIQAAFTPGDPEEVLALADMYFDYIREEACGE